jgi:hypothetical protein
MYQLLSWKRKGTTAMKCCLEWVQATVQTFTNNAICKPPSWNSVKVPKPAYSKVQVSNSFNLLEKKAILFTDLFTL